MGSWDVDACAWVEGEQPKPEPPPAWWAVPVEPPGDVAAIRARIKRLREGGGEGKAWREWDGPPPGEVSVSRPHLVPLVVLWQSLAAVGEALGEKVPPMPNLQHDADVTGYLGGSRYPDAWGEYHQALSVAASFVDSLSPVPQNAPPAEGEPPAGRRPGANARMIDVLSKKQDAKFWTAAKWAVHLGYKSESTIKETAAWKELSKLRAVARAERGMNAAKRASQS